MYKAEHAINISDKGYFDFVNLKYLLISNCGKKVFFLYQKLKWIHYAKNLCAFEICETADWGLVDQNNLIRYEPLSVHKMSDKKMYILE